MRVSVKSYFSHLWELVFFVALCISVPIYFNSVYEDDISALTLQIAVCGFILLCVPAIILFVRYFSLSKNTEITFGESEVIVDIQRYRRTIKVEQIKSMEIKLSIPVFYRGLRMLATDSFLYAQIFLKTGESFTVTSLIDEELIDTINFFKDKTEVKRKLRFICWPPNQNLKLDHK